MYFFIKIDVKFIFNDLIKKQLNQVKRDYIFQDQIMNFFILFVERENLTLSFKKY